MKQRFTQLIAQAVQARRVLISSLAVVTMLAAAVYVYAAVGVTVNGGAVPRTISISADNAANSQFPVSGTFNPVGDIVILEGADGDFRVNGSLILTAPAGWIFKGSGVSTLVENGNPDTGNQNTNVTINDNNISYASTTITIPFTRNNTNQPDKVTIRGVEIKAVNGGNIPGSGTIILGASVSGGTTTVVGLPQDIVSVSQAVGAARSLAFRQQPSTVNVGAAISPAPQVAVVDQFGNTVTSATGSIGLALTGIPNTALIDPSSGATATITNGVATFSNVRIDEGGNFNLVASYTLNPGQTLQGTSADFVVNNLVPTISSALPCITVGDGQNTVNVTGTGFVRGSIVRINGVSRATTFVSSTSISATLLPEDVNTAQTLTLTVFNPTPAGGSSNAVDFVIHPVLEAGTISGNTEVCEGAQNVVYSVEAIAGATFNWQVGPGATIVSGGTTNTIEVRFVGSSTPTVNISVQALNACGIAGDPSSIDVTVTPYPTGISAGPDEGVFYCTGESATLGSGDPAVPGYTYSWSPVEGLSDPNVPNPTVNLTNSSSVAEFRTYTLTVTNGEAACVITDQVTVTVYPALIIAADDVEPVCVGNSIELRVTGDPSYTYAWTGPEEFTSSEQNPVIPNATEGNEGTYTVVVTNQQGCEATAEVDVDIAPLPTANAGADQNLCTQGASTSFTVTGTLSAGAAGIWNVVEGTATIASETSLETEVSVTSASATLRFTAETPEGCQAFDDVVLTVDPLPEVSLTAFADVCVSDGLVTLTGGEPINGTYSGPGVTDGKFNPAVAGVGTHTITYTYTNGNGCTDAATQTITVKPQPVVSVASNTGSFEICIGESILLTASGATTYRWEPATGLSATTGASVTANPTTTTTYSVYGTTNGCESVAQIVTVTVNPLPNVSITPTGPTEFCDGNYVDLVTENVAGYTYQWFDANDNSSVGAASTFRAIETGRYYVTVTTDKGCTLTSEAVSIIVAKLPNEASISAGTTTFCEGGSVQISANSAPQGQTYEYVWEFSSTNTEAGFTPITGVPVTSNTYVADASGYYRVKVSDVTEGNVSDCFKTSQPIQVTVLPQPTADITSAAETQCQVESGRNTFTVTGTYSGGTGTTGNWSATNGFTVTGTTYSTVNGVTITTTTITAPASFSGTANVLLIATNAAASCAPASDQITLTVQPLIAGNTITGTSEYCQNAAATALSSGTITGGNDSYTYQWQSGSSATGTFTNISGATTASYIPSTATGGTTYYKRVVTSGECSNTSAAFAVTVTPSITTNTIAGTQNYCEDEPATALGGAVAGGTGSYTYQWQSSSSATGTFTDITTATAATYVPSTATGGTTYYRRLVTSGECADNASNVIGVTVTPAITANNITGAATYCQGATAAALGGTVTGGVTEKTYLWEQSPNGTTQWTSAEGTNDQISYTPSTATAGTTHYRRVVTSENCSSESNVVAVTVTPSITANTISGDATYCQGATAAALGGTVTGGLTSKTYLWQQSPVGSNQWTTAAGTSNQENYTPSTAIANTMRYRRVVTSGECSTTSNEVTVTVTPSITANTISGAATYCQGATAAALGGTVSGGLTSKTYLWQQSPNGTDQWTTAGGTNSQVSYTPSTATVGTVHYRRVVTSGECSSNSNVVAITVNSPIAGNQISGTQTVCSGGPVAPLGQASNTSLSGGSTPYTYQWQSSTSLNGTYANVTGGTGATSATYTPGPRTVTTATTVYYKRVVSGGQCSSISEAVAVTFNPVIANNSISGAQTVCAGVAPSQLTGTLPTGGAGTNSYTYLWESSTTSATAGFSAAAGTNTGRNYSPGALQQTTWFRRVVTSGGCSSTSPAVRVLVTPITTLTLVLQASPFPVCPGQQTTYTATVIANATSVSYPANPRYEEITWEGGTDVSSMFTFDWWKNDNVDNQEGQTGRTVSQAGLSSTDYFTVRAKPNSSFSYSCYNYVNQPELTPNDNKGNVLFSNRIYLGQPSNYDVTISRVPEGSICQGTRVTFTATPNADYVNLTLEWVVTNSAGAIIDRTPFSANKTYTSNTLNNGDVVSLNFTSEENKCQPVATSTPITMVVVIPQTMAGGGAYCAGGTGVPVSITSSQQGVTYQLLRTVGSTTVTVGSPVAGTGGAVNFGNQTIAGTYTVQPISANGACSPVYGPVNVYSTPAPIAYNVTGGGAYCANGSGVPIGLSSSQTGVSYRLYRGTTAVGTAITGTGAAISFGNQTVAGTYTVVATTIASATTAACPTTMTGNATVVVNPLPTVTVNSPTTCENTPVTVTAVPSGGTGPYTYTWTVPSGVTNPGSVASFQTTVAGNYTVRVTDSKSCASSAAATSTVTVNPRPTVTVNNPTVCSGTEATVIAAATGGTGPYTYTWTVPSGVTNPGNVASFPTTVAGTYTVRVTDSRSCASSEAATSTVTVNPLVTSTGSFLIENVNGQISESNPIMPGEWVKITALSDIEDDGVALSHEWSVGNDVGGDWEVVKTGRENFLIIDPVEPGEFNVKVEILPNNDGVICYANLTIITSEPLVPLPVEIIYFNAAKQGHNVLLEWATASEEHNTGFEVQVSQDGFNFRKLDFVPTKNGNTAIKQVYQYTDKENGKRGTRYYRLKQIDEDGRFEYFTTKAVTFTEVASKVKAFPNPFTTNVTLDIAAENSGQVQVTMWNAVGRQLMERTVEVEEGFNTVNLDINGDLPHGVYFIRVYLDGKMHQLKMLKE